MTRLRTRLLVPVLSLLFLLPALAKALPKGEAGPLVAERLEVTPSHFSQFWGLLSALWAETGSVLEPDGSPKPNAGNSGDTGSGLEPDGRL
jgi:hypothetical protein